MSHIKYAQCPMENCGKKLDKKIREGETDPDNWYRCPDHGWISGNNLKTSRTIKIGKHEYFI